jgi:hypothetical protein
MDIMNQMILPAFSSVLLAIIGLAVSYVIKLLKSKGIIAKLEANKSVVAIVVNAIEQIYKNTDTKSEDKLQAAEDYISKILSNKGIKVSADEIRVLIENSVREINTTVQKELNNTVENVPSATNIEDKTVS